MNGFSTRRKLGSVKPTQREIAGANRYWDMLHGIKSEDATPVPAKRERDPDAGSEGKEQIRVIRWWDGTRERLGAHVHYKLPQFVLAHVPNGAGRLSAQLAGFLKAMGLRPGNPDLHLYVPRGRFHGAVCEMKYGRNKESENQIDFLEHFRAAGWAVRTAWSGDEAIDFFQDYLDGKL